MSDAEIPKDLVFIEKDGHFEILVPRGYVEAGEVTKVVEYLRKSHRREGRQQAAPKKITRIMLVDDFATTRTLISQMLTDELQICTPSEIVQARDGREALTKLLSEPEVDFIISDWNMPEMTGYELLTAIRSNEQLKSIPFLMVTAEGEMRNVKMALKAGVSGYILKPFTPQKLKEKLRQMRLIG